MRQRVVVMMAMLGALLGASASAGVVDDLLQSYQSSGAGDFNAARGEALWKQSFPAPDAGQTRSCLTCHGTSLQKGGTHSTTGKAIEPMAPSVNKQRLTDPKFIEKWFKRNCEWTLGRECTLQEKGDVLVFLRGQ